MSQGPAEISIETDFDLEAASTDVQLQGGSLPFRIGSHKLSSPNAATVVHVCGNAGTPTARYFPEAQRLEFQASADELSRVDLLFLSYLLLEAQLQRFGFVTLHAAAVERQGAALLLLGHSGAGKTTTAITLCREFGCRLVGNDLVLVGGPDGLQTLSGTTHIRLRYSAVMRYLPSFADRFERDTRDPWREKKDFAPSELGVSVSGGPAHVVQVIFVHLNDRYSEPVVAPGNTWIHRSNLYENALRHVRATATPWLMGDNRQLGPYVPSLDDPSLHEARTRTVNRLLVRSTYLAGQLADLAPLASKFLDQPLDQQREVQ